MFCIVGGCIHKFIHRMWLMPNGSRLHASDCTRGCLLCEKKNFVRTTRPYYVHKIAIYLICKKIRITIISLRAKEFIFKF